MLGRDIAENPANWRGHPQKQVDALHQIIDEVGMARTVLAYYSERNGGELTLIDGHARIREYPDAVWDVDILDVTDEEADKLLLALDNIGDAATIRLGQLKVLRERVGANGALDALVSLAAKQTSRYDIEQDSKFGDDDIDEATEPSDTPGDVLAEQYGVELGQLWQCGNHRVICGDSRDAAVLERLMDGDKAAAMWTDPPYGVEYVGRTEDALTIENDGAKDLPDLLSRVFAAVDEVLVDGAAIYVAHPAGALSLVFMNEFVNTGWKFHEVLIWVKDTMVLGHSDYHYQHEPVLYGWKGTNRTWLGGRNKVSVFNIDRPKRSSEHPTMKPPTLIIEQLKNNVQKGDIVLDPFGGSGSTMMACEHIGAHARLVELSPAFVAVQLARYEKATNGKAVLL